jgi:DNA (cytosine-5)-methyltransferase 1
MKRTFVELFAGIGLMRVAFEAEGWECVFANEMCPKKCVIYNANFQEPNVLECDLRDLNCDAIPPADAWVLSFPCTDVSRAQKMHDEGILGSQTGVIWYVFELLKSMSPENAPHFLFLENVPGLLSSKNFVPLVACVDGLGYEFDLTTVDAKHFVPQTRERVFMCARKRCATSTNSTEEVRVRELGTRPRKVERLFKKLATSALNWNPHPIPPAPTRNPESTLESILETEKFGRHDCISQQSTDRILESMLDKTLLDKAPYWVGDRHAGKRAGTKFYVQPDNLSYCLVKAHTLIVIKSEGNMMRYMTERECARLQGVGDDFVFPTGIRKTVIRKAFGDAVCVPAVRWAIRTMLSTK